MIILWNVEFDKYFNVEKIKVLKKSFGDEW